MVPCDEKQRQGQSDTDHENTSSNPSASFDHPQIDLPKITSPIKWRGIAFWTLKRCANISNGRETLSGPFLSPLGSPCSFMDGHLLLSAIVQVLRIHPAQFSQEIWSAVGLKCMYPN
ncbi:hypothetical protein MJO28_013892 [Puccinia striiformis f. sp. tritici]|uniref:Uncharacterized protein n=1 Tax=Puccinia striiformis f. sp. tritici TaxID=168172 RepID=A0ACC0DWX9_9BASI|nr:hypothetical protein Pst134EA_025599 [Puccinia striiformis f. sp. tritici]KAH9443826.1 hypothetical protein Pst134EB_026217 [Puccinia striiformis f. sp. tritici]KAH9451656.1 hypothetical protein Pst134EA_025599 [Puccinia striiformis f. sp. tritici]KAI7940240.1 hypothetical protein MJO28_013892 [Puccinia striiformis f. sp. tritici]